MKNEEKLVDYPVHIETKVALLGQSFDNINETLKEIKYELKEIKSEIRDFRKETKDDFKDIRKEMKSDFRWILAIISGLGGIMAKGFHWF